ncbi:outer membrane lipoprotein carrier protein LolA [Virgibacillus oceani]
MNKIKTALLLVGVMIMVAGCSEESSNYSPEQMINHAMAEEELPAYYAESTSIISTEDNDEETVFMKEWRSEDGKIRIEAENAAGDDRSIVVNDGSSVITYQIDENQAIVIDDEELLEFNQPSPKEQANTILDIIRDSHEISSEGDGEVAGRDTYHLVAEPNDENSLFGELELWIDRENWMVLKMISWTGDQMTEVVYTKFEQDAEISGDKFTLDIPDDAEITNLNDFNNTEEITLEDAADGVGKPFYYFPEEEGMEISNIEKFDIVEQTEVNIEYTKEDVPFATLAVSESPEDIDDDFTMPDEEEVTVRGVDGTFTDTDGLRLLNWQEDGLTYSMIVIDPSIEVEDLQQLAEQMELVE